MGKCSQIEPSEQILSRDDSLKGSIDWGDDDDVSQVHVSHELHAVLERVCGKDSDWTFN